MVRAKTDALTHTPVVIESIHHEIHEGEMYQVGVSSTSLGNDKWLSLATPGSASAQMHFTFNASLDGTCQVELIEDATYATAGTTTGTATAYNMHRGKSDFSVAMIANSSTVTGGTALIQTILPGGKVGQAAGVAGGSRPGLEWITDPTKKYLMRVINKAGAAKAASLEVNFYIHAVEPRGPG